MRSLQRELLAWILGALSLGAIVIALVTYLVTLEEMNEVFDANLKNVAQALATYHDAGPPQASSGAFAAPPAAPPSDEYDIVTLAWTSDGRRIYASEPDVMLPFTNLEGPSRPRVGEEEWNMYTNIRATRVVQAAQRVSARQQMAAESASELLAPMAAIVVLVCALLVFALRRGLEPLNRAARDVAARSASSLAPVAGDRLPRELSPLLHSINDLMQRLAVSFAAQRRFVADAAHELRTPVTALRLQLALLRRARDEPAREAALAELDAGIERSQRLIEQLLQLSRAEPDGRPQHIEPLPLAELARTAVSAASAAADHKGIDLGAEASSQAVVNGDRLQLGVLLENLVHNALRHTSRGGVVDVVAAELESRPVIRVIDNGPGIPETERARVFDRFYRGENALGLPGEASGSGLGLAIVRAIAERHGAEVSLHTAPSGRGLEVRVAFPA